ncbi:hypothetical protein L4D20_23935 [Vibrio kyushuensis]|uniref:polysaccharide lyase n=1 Tax=Vibrio kyushuensis TaxID=2910249 RepID=UPI003D102AB1
MFNLKSVALLSLLVASSASANSEEKGNDQNADNPPTTEHGYLWSSGYENTPWDEEWGLKWKQEGNHSIVSTDVFSGRKAQQVTYPKGTFSRYGGAQYYMDFALLNDPIPYSDEMYVRYYLKFNDDVDFIKGGKLPGLLGGEANTGGGTPTGMDGWTARIMWRRDGRIVQYVYHPDQTGRFGEDLDWNHGGADRFFTPGKWHCVETYIKMNTVSGTGEANSNADGIVRSWLDGELALDKTDMRFRYTDAFNIDGFYFSTFFGGGDASWAPVKDETVMFDNFVINDKPIGCLDSSHTK